MKNVNKFQIVKFQPQDIAYYCLNFLPVSAWQCLYTCIKGKISKCIENSEMVFGFLRDCIFPADSVNDVTKI